MRMWQVVALVNLTLAVGFGIGYDAWGSRLAAVSADIRTAQAQVEQLTHERRPALPGVASANINGRGEGSFARFIRG